MPDKEHFREEAFTLFEVEGMYTLHHAQKDKATEK